MSERFSYPKGRVTYYLLVKTSIVRVLYDCMIEIIWIALVPVLQLVEEIKKFEGEGGQRPSDCHGESTCLEKLGMLRNTVRTTIS